MAECDKTSNHRLVSNKQFIKVGGHWLICMKYEKLYCYVYQALLKLLSPSKFD